METVNINGKYYTKKEFLNVLRATDESGLFKTFATLQIERHRLRPMSELPEANKWVNVLIEHKSDLFWGDGYIYLNRIELRYLGQDCWKNKGYVSEENVKALGWLPKEVLPNPNEIKPC